MSLKEKVENMGSAGTIPSSELELYNWCESTKYSLAIAIVICGLTALLLRWSEGTHGVASGGSVARSQFAMPITTGQSFNRSLWRATGAQIVRASPRCHDQTHIAA
jgi:hypothetical protein